MNEDSTVPHSAPTPCMKNSKALKGSETGSVYFIRFNTWYHLYMYAIHFRYRTRSYERPNVAFLKFNYTFITIL